MRMIRKYRKDVLAITALFVVAILVGGYILNEQRLRFPLIDDKPFIVKAEFSTAQAVVPGQGQTVRVSGIRVGDIGGTELKEGRAIITMELDRKFEKLVRRDASALLRPKTGLKDMFIELNPGRKGTPVVTEGWTMPISSTLPDVNPDEFLQSLDTDTRDYVKLLLNGAAKGLKGRDDDLRQVLQRFEPTYRDLAAVNSEVKGRRNELRRLIRSLNVLNGELKSKDDDLAELVDSSATVFRAFASERQGVEGFVRELPGALKETREGLAKVEAMAKVLRPASVKLIPVAEALDRSNRATRPFLKEAVPQLRDAIRPFVREARPLVRDLRPAARDLNEAEPQLKRSFKVLNNLFNMIGFNPKGREAPGPEDREEGYLFHFAWGGHQASNLFSNTDAHGPMRSLTTGGTCSTIAGTAQTFPEQEFGQLLSGVLTDPAVCGGQVDLPLVGDLPGLPVKKAKR